MQFSLLVTLAFTTLALASPAKSGISQREQQHPKRCIGSAEEIEAVKAEAQAALDAGKESPLVDNGEFICQTRGDGVTFVCSDNLGSDCV